MKEKILALLEAKFQGERKDGLNHLARVLSLQVTTEEEANVIVGKLSADQVSGFIADWRKDADAEIDKSNQTREANLRKKYDFVEKKPGNPKEPDVPPATGTLDAAAIQKIVAEAVGAATKPLLEEVNAWKGSAIHTERRELLEKELSDVPESYKGKVLKDFDRMSFKDADVFNAYLDETKKDVSTFNQELADKGLSGHGKPLFGTVDKEGVSAGVLNYIKESAEGDKKLTGKEL
jgi:hypothetical protein